MADRWTRLEDELPPEGTYVETKIEDEHGARNRTRLVRHGQHYFLPPPSEDVHIYYRPTHWRPLDDLEAFAETCRQAVRDDARRQIAGIDAALAKAKEGRHGNG